MIIPKKEKMENARSYALRLLTQNIISLELPPGSSVSENEISSQIQVSRTPVREALIELSKMGLIEIIPQRGSYVTKIDYALIEDSRFIRLALEDAIVKLACAQIDDTYIRQLEENLQRQKECIDSEDMLRFLEHDNEFHKLIFYSVGKEYAYEFLKPQMVHFDRLRTLTLKSLKYQKNYEDHENLLYAIKRKDAELAGMIITRHLERLNFDKQALMEKYSDYFVN